MNPEILADRLAILETGLRTDSAQLESLGREMGSITLSARQFGLAQSLTTEVAMDWQLQWDRVDQALARTRTLVLAMAGAVECTDPARLTSARESWDAIQLEDAQLLVALGAVRKHVRGLGADVRREWNGLARLMEFQLEALHSCAQALRIKLELLKDYPGEDVTRLMQGVVARLPAPEKPRAVPGPKLFDREYRKAALELGQEMYQHRGYMDFVKGLLVWAESPEERVLKNRSLQVDES